MAGEEEPQRFITPYYLIRDGVEETILPASSHSLVAQIMQEGSAEGAHLSAQVAGGTGSFRYAWGSWRLDAGLSGGFRSHGGSGAITLPVGVHNVILDVEDRRTREFARVQAIVNVQAPAEQLVS
jgi:hypothetical protein